MTAAAHGLATDPILEMSDVAKRFGGVQALRKVDLSILPGTTGLIGPNGSGKTTLFNCVTGAIRSDTGRINWRGTDISSLSMPRRAGSGIVAMPQNPCVFERLSVRDNVRLATEIVSKRERSASDVDATIGELLTLTGLADAATTRAGDLSYGHQRLLNLAMVLAIKPVLLMLDEPGAGLNDDDKRRLAEVVARLRATDVSFVIIEHDVQFLFSLADRVAVLDAGELLAVGTPEEIRTNEEVIRVYLG